MALAHPAFLISLAALAVPVIIHLSRRRKFQDLSIGTLRFLHLANEKRRFRLRVENLPLLLLRLLALASLISVFLFPYPRKNASPEAGKQRLLVLLDASGSMNSEMAAQALKLAREAARGTPDVTYARFADDVELLASLDQYSAIGGARTDFTKALDWSLDHLRRDGVSDAKVVVIGHFASNALPAVPPRVWPPRIHVETLAVNPPDQPNHAVRGLESLTPFVTRSMEAEAWISPSPNQRTVRLSGEGLNLKQQVPGGTDRVVLSFRPPKPECRGTIRIESEDPWPADDERPFLLDWTNPVPVLLIDGSPGSTPFEGQAYFVDKALSASGAAHGLSPFKPEIHFGLEGRQGTLDLTSFQAAAWCGPGQALTADVRQITTFVNSGKGLLIALDSKWDAVSCAPLVDAGLLPEKLSVSASPVSRKIRTWDAGHPAMSLFSTEQGIDPSNIPWRAGFSVETTSAWKVIARLDGGQPLLLEKERADTSAGKILVFLHPLTREWSDAPLDPLFAPFVKSLFAYLADYRPPDHHARTHSPGIHETRPIGLHESPDEAPVLVVADADESDVASVSAAEFRKAYGLPLAENTAEQPGPPPGAGNTAAAPPSNDWWPWIALGLVVLLCLEWMVATRRITHTPPKSAA